MSRKNSSGACGARTRFRGARTLACRVHTRVNAWSPSRICARPRIFLRSGSQSRLHRIPLDVVGDPAPLFLASHPVVVRLALPKLLPCRTKQPVRFPRRDAFQGFQQEARRNRGKQKQVNVIGHDDERPEAILSQLFSPKERLNHQRCNVFSPEMHWTGVCHVEKTIHPHESLAVGDLAGGWKMRAGQAAMQMPGKEQPAVVRIDMGKPSLGRHSLNSGVIGLKFSRSHECERGTQECVRHGTECVRHGTECVRHGTECVRHGRGDA